MIIFLYGTDSYRLKQARRDVVGRYQVKHKSGINLFYSDFSQPADIDSCRDALRTYSFFNEHRLIICENVFGKKSSAEALVKLIEDYRLIDDRDATVLVSEDLSEKELRLGHDSLFRILSAESSTVKNIEKLEGTKLYKWIVEEFNIRDCSATERVAKKIVDLVSNDSWRIINEIEKTAAYRVSGEVVIQDVDLLVNSKTDPNIFNLIDAMAAKNRSRSLELLYQELKLGRDPYYVLTMVAYQLRNLLMVKDMKAKGYGQIEVAKRTRINPFVVRKILNTVDRFSQEELIKTYNQISNLDVGFKNGTLNLEDSLYSLFSGLSKA